MAAVRHVCECISRRAAYLVSAGLATLINKMNEPRVTVGIDGSLYRFHPHFHTLMQEKISQLIRPGIQQYWHGAEIPERPRDDSALRWWGVQKKNSQGLYTGLYSRSNPLSLILDTLLRELAVYIQAFADNVVLMLK
ncbi:Hexokinase type 2 [Eumeta japonica]|uniref:Phosphotransferase n=1 Tax=Eumeta variegata TaxID=151549 RepID=A0A4C1ZA09_EUMVA|nr:Hexokinase type 2 [Eumeta japonica]